MPAAIPAIAAAAASYGATAWAVSAGLVAAGSIGATVIGAAASFAVSSAVGALIKPDAPDLSANLNAPGGGRTQQVRQPISPHQIIFGRIKCSGAIVFVHTTTDEHDRVNGWLYLVHALSGVHVAEIGDVYIGDDLSTDTRFDGAPGESRLVTLSKNLGATDQAADAMLVADIADAAIWGADHRLRGRAYLVTRLQWHPVGFSSGIPNIAAIVRGDDEIYDPRDESTGWQNNAALCIAKWFTAPFGMGLSWSELDEDSVVAAANICDERVLVASGSTTFQAEEDPDNPGEYTGSMIVAEGARKLDVGDGVRLTTTGSLPGGLVVGSTYYAIPSGNETVKLAPTHAAAIAGIGVAISSPGTGTQTMTYWDEARYKLNGTFTLDAAKGDVLEQLLSAMAGVAVYIGGQWFLYAGAAASPTVTLTEDDLRGDMQYVPKRSMRDRFNGVRAVYVNPDANWQPVDAPPLQSETYLEEDDDEELIEDIRLPFTTSTRAIQRLMKIALGRNRRQGIVQFPAKLTAMRLQPWDGVYLDIERYDWDQKQSRVIGWALADDGGIDLTLQEDDAGVYAWTAAEEIATAVQQGVVLPDPSAITPPDEVIIETPIGAEFSQINAEWSEVKTIWLNRYDVEYRPAGGTDWISYGAIGADAARVAQIERGAATDVRVRAVTKNGNPSEFMTNLAPAVPGSVVATGGEDEISVTFVNAVDVEEVQIFGADTNDAGTAELLDTIDGDLETFTETGLGAAQTRWYFLRSVNADGNISALTPGVSGTTD